MIDIRSIHTIVTDVDGVFTPGQYLYDTRGKVYKIFGPHDSDGIKILKSMKIDVHAVSADKRGFDITQARMNDIDIPLTYVKEDDRLKYILDNYDMKHTAFVGDGIFDAACLRHARIGFAPSNATLIAKRHADIVLKSSGGEGVFLEIALDYFISEKDFYKRIRIV